MSFRKGLLGLGLLGLSCFAGSALADSGPYIGVQGGASLESDTTASASSSGVSGSGPLKFRDGPTGGVVAGYSFENGLRPEIEANYHRNSLSNGGGDLRAATVVGSLNYNVSQGGYFFYAGAGAGFANLHAHDDQGGSDSDNQAVYQAGTGFGVAATKNLLVGIDYRYLGTFDRANFHFNYSGTPVEENFHYRTNVLTLALRYSFGRLSDSSFASNEASAKVVPVALPSPPR